MDHDGQYIAIDATSFVNNNSIDDNRWMDGVDTHRSFTINGGKKGREAKERKGHEIIETER